MNKTVFTFLTGTAVLMLFISGCANMQKAVLPTTRSVEEAGLSPRVEPWEDSLRTDPEKGEFEWWYFDFSFSDGSTAVIFFSTKSFMKPEGKPDPEVNLVITDPSGSKYSASDTPGKEYFSASKTGLDVRIGSSYVKGDLSGCTVHFEKDAISMDVNLVSKAPAWRPGTGMQYYGKKEEYYFGWLPSIPYGEAEGTLTYNGKTAAVSGTGYHDHNWGNVRLDKVCTQWYWGRARIGDYTIIFSDILTTPKYGSVNIPVFYLARGNEILSKEKYDFSFTPSRWTRHPGGRDYPRKLLINVGQDDMTAGLEISNPVFIEAQALLDAAPWIVRVLMRPLENPYYFRFNADFNLTVKTKEGGTAEETGKGIFEMMLLKGLQTVR